MNWLASSLDPIRTLDPHINDTDIVTAQKVDGPPHDRAQLTDAIAKAEARVAELEAARAAELERIAELTAQLSATPPPACPPQLVSIGRLAPRSPAEKVRIFRDLFRGRSDVYPTRFVSKKTGKPGYAPACNNKFVPGLCGLPKVKCGECSNQGFPSVDDAAILDHLRGHHVMGMYPMLEDETCWFLAIDFDKSAWLDDVRATAATCRRLRLPHAVERSRSGNGAHVWFFFSSPVAVSVARKLGSYVLTETMATRHEIGMESYDRLFPSQDTMPRGGFGNLIALPLQLGPRQSGNSEFLDADLVPFPGEEQWDHLAALERIDLATIDRIVADAARSGGVVGIRVADAEDAATPWMKPLSGRPRMTRLTGPLPDRVSAVLAQRLFVNKTGLPSPVIDQLKRLAAFQNPEFYKKQSMRLSVATTPRVISCAEDLPLHVALPRGCQPAVAELLREYEIALDVEDQRTMGEPIAVRFQGTLTGVQQEAVRALLVHDLGVFVAPPGIGKTVIGTYLVAARGCSTLILVHRRPLLDQWLAQLSMFLGIDVKEVGQIGAGKQRANGRIDVAMIQSLVRRDSVSEVVESYGQVIVDECHHLSAVSYERVVAAAKARYVVGLTATPQRRDGHHPIIEMQLGPVRFAVDAKAHARHRPFEHRLVVRETSFRPSVEAPKIQDLYAALADDETRNRLILNDVLGALEEGRSPILLTERIDHLDYFATRLERAARHVIVLKGGMGAKAARTVRERLATIPPHEERIVLATGRYIGEGFDDPRLDTLFLTLPVSWRGTLVQYTGRLHRLHPGKREVRIFDYVDREVPMLLRMFEKRLRGYRAIGYARGEAPLGYEEPQELTIEYDEVDSDNDDFA
jgi:superfamily II DNA or RNA helicase